MPRGGRATTALLASVAAAALLLTSCGGAEPGSTTMPAPTATDAQAEPNASDPAEGVPGTLDEPAELATGLQAPWSIAFLDERTALISERDTMVIRSLSLDGSGAPSGEAQQIAQLSGGTASGEGGLLGIAIGDGHLYWYLSTADDNRVARATIVESDGGILIGQPEEVLTGIPVAGNHNGGRLAFGPDGMLYVTTGDAGAPGTAQDPDSLAGKILRLEPDGSIPADNPVAGSPVYTLGHRNPQGIAWAEDGTMFATEFGQDTWDELNRIEAGANYGWPAVEGIAEVPRFTDPVQQWSPGEASPSGMAAAGGSLWIANLRGESVREVSLDEPAASVVHWQGRFGRMRDVVAAPDGSLWALTNATDGRGQPAEGDDRILRFAP
ncbi:PQQ-dependent sugar dehydrogenase [Agrococcus sp. Marseille-P2731]|uniref:PQQ-dependent sugar dehydrogenase n=1 Tax=Agrococcus sp. Marseille-P2731 TaxID=1841862 RepID=UPI000931F507|nr:PQQ-dependent sugar dehydrogenase [Agrococcus sp. Marseille-P2731]